MPPFILPPEELAERLRALDVNARARIETMLPWLVGELLARGTPPDSAATQEALRILIGVEMSGGDCTDRELVDYYRAVIPK